LDDQEPEQTLGLTIARLVNTVEMLRRLAPIAHVDPEGSRAEVMQHLNELGTVPGELMLACEILSAEFPPTSPAHQPLTQLWLSAIEEIEAQKARFNEALKVARELDAGPRH
jgi:hypothetical protein